MTSTIASPAAATPSWSTSSRSPTTTTRSCAALIAEHAQRTGSLVARNLLAEWEQGARDRFVKVMPRDYKRALSEQAEAAAAVAGSLAGNGAEGVALTEAHTNG